MESKSDELSIELKSDEAPVEVGREWSEQEEYLLVLWADRSMCYRILNERAHRKFYTEHLCFSIPVIVLSTIAGTANFATQTYVPESYQMTAQMIIGIVNIFCGILTTLHNFFRSSEKCEAHRNSSSSWGKLYRLIFVELSLERKKRKPVKDFVRQCKNEYDRIIEQTPIIPMDILDEFKKTFLPNTEIIIPEECGNLIHTSSWEHVKSQRLNILEWKNLPASSLEASVIEGTI
jgi:hypothetical protein